MEYTTLLLILACAFGFFMAWGIGANDVANAMGTSVGSKALTITQAIIIAAIFEAAGALLAGGEVTDTIRGKIIDMDAFDAPPEYLVYGMMAALLAAGSWLLIATYFGWPVSTTHSIVGAIVGFASVQIGVQAVHWDQVGHIVLSWVFTPFIAGILAYFIFRSIQRFILLSDDPLRNAKRYLPIYIFFVGFIISVVTVTKGLKHLNIDISTSMAYLLSTAIGISCSLIGAWGIHNIKAKAGQPKKFDFTTTERAFGWLMVFTACGMAFAHGSNDVANAIGPLAAIISILKNGGDIAVTAAVPIWVLGIGAAGIVAGLATFGYRVIATIGKNITELTPSRGFAAELATASTVVIASGTGLPISTTQTLVGAVLGVGLARGLSALKLNVIRNIFMSWIITLPAGAILAIIYFFMLRFILGS